MFCPNCGQENSETSSYCSNCGAAINGTIPPTKKKQKKVLWIIVAILGAIILFCLAPIGYGYYKITSYTTPTPIATDTPQATLTPEPTQTPVETNTPSVGSIPVNKLNGKWQSSTDKSSFDDSQTVTLTLRANKVVTGWLDDTAFPVLVLRCKEKKTEAYIVVGMQQNVESGLYDQSTVRIRFDSDQAQKMITDHSTDGKALFFRDPVSLINTMLMNQQMVFGFTPFNASPVETDFDLHGLENVIGPLKDACK